VNNPQNIGMGSVGGALEQQLLGRIGHTGPDAIQQAREAQFREDTARREAQLQEENELKKTLLIVLGILLGAFGFAQVLQLIGLIGTKRLSIPGAALALLGFALSAACFQKVFASKKEEE